MREFDNQQRASEFAAQTISKRLLARLEVSERACLVVSGGSTPIECLSILSNMDLPWGRIDVTLTDERNVPVDHAESNEKMVRETLLTANAATARFVRLGEENIKSLQPFACCLAGMGEDGHFASIFPDSPQLKEAITSIAEVLVVTTPSSPLSRTTMTLDSLIKSDELVLLVFGEEKRKILSAPDEYTISHLLDASPVHVVWAP